MFEIRENFSNWPSKFNKVRLKLSELMLKLVKNHKNSSNRNLKN